MTNNELSWNANNNMYISISLYMIVIMLAKEEYLNVTD